MTILWMMLAVVVIWAAAWMLWQGFKTPDRSEPHQFGNQ